MLDIGVAYGEDLARVRRVLAEVAHDLWEDEDFKGRVIEEPEVWGVEELAADAVIVRVALKTAPLEQWAVAREMRAADQGPLRPRGHRDPVPPAGGVAARRAAPATARSPTRTSSSPAEGPSQAEAGDDDDVTTTFYDEIGGAETIRTIVHRFYEGVAEDELLRPLYPEEDLGPAEERFPLFLVAVLGRPDDVLRHPRAPAPADAARAVRGHPGRGASAGWCTSAPGSTQAALTPEQDERFWDYVTHAAQFMVNTLE